jgi:hypothetical protein
MYQLMAIANYEDRFVIPTSHREVGEDAYDVRGSCGFSFGNGCSGGTSDADLFGAKRRGVTDADRPDQGARLMHKALKIISLLLSYPRPSFWPAAPELKAALAATIRPAAGGQAAAWPRWSTTSPAGPL